MSCCKAPSGAVGGGLLPAVVLGLVLAAAPATGAGAVDTPAAPQSLVSVALVGATLVDGSGAPPLRDAVVLLRGDRIECAGSRTACPLPAGARITDLSGLWLTPGLVDAHVHFSQTGWADGRPDALDVRAAHPYERVEADLARHPERLGHSYSCSGVTAVFDVGGYPWTLDLQRRAEGDSTMPRVAAAGPLLSTIDFWLNLPAEKQFLHLDSAAAATSEVSYLAARQARAVKVWYIVTAEQTVEKSAPLVRAAGDAARAQGLPLIVHATGLAEAKEALRAGAKLLVHSVGDLPVDDEFLSLARAGGAIYCPTLIVFRGYLRMFAAAANHQAPSVDDPNGCVDAQTLAKVAETATVSVSMTAAQLASFEARVVENEQVAAANLKRVAAAGIPIAMGTDAGNPMTLHGPAVYAEMEAMQAAGLTPMEVLVASTRGGAAAMGRAAELGTVERGRLADLLVVAADPTQNIANLRRVRYVVRGGVLRSLAELQALAKVASEGE